MEESSVFWWANVIERDNLKGLGEEWWIIIEGRQCTYNVILRRLRATIVTVGKQ
jgi:hypothetical protein